MTPRPPVIKFIITKTYKTEILIRILVSYGNIPLNISSWRCGEDEKIRFYELSSMVANFSISIFPPPTSHFTLTRLFLCSFVLIWFRSYFKGFLFQFDPIPQSGLDRLPYPPKEINEFWRDFLYNGNRLQILLEMKKRPFIRIEGIYEIAKFSIQSFIEIT